MRSLAPFKEPVLRYLQFLRKFTLKEDPTKSSVVCFFVSYRTRQRRKRRILRPSTVPPLDPKGTKDLVLFLTNYRSETTHRSKHRDLNGDSHCPFVSVPNLLVKRNRMYFQLDFLSHLVSCATNPPLFLALPHPPLAWSAMQSVFVLYHNTASFLTTQKRCRWSVEGGHVSDLESLHPPSRPPYCPFVSRSSINLSFIHTHTRTPPFS